MQFVESTTPMKKAVHTETSFAVPLDFPRTGLVRLKSILHPAGPIPVGKTTWWEGVRSGRFPKPSKLSPKTTVWRAEDIHDLIAKAFSNAGQPVELHHLDVSKLPDGSPARADVGARRDVRHGRGGS
jgi:prophage regulatory protein